MFTVREAAKKLGLTEKGLRAWISQRKINFHKLGGAIRISEKEIDRLIKESLRPAIGLEK